MADIDLDAIAQRAEAATPGPWTVNRDNWQVYGVGHDGLWNREVPVVTAYFGGAARSDVEKCGRTLNSEFIAHAREDVPALVAEVRRLTAERDSLARWKAEALPVMSAFLDLARRAVPESALGRFLPDALAEHIDRQEAALREVGAWATPETACAGCPPEGWDFDAWEVRLNAFAEVRAILARHSGGESDG